MPLRFTGRRKSSANVLDETSAANPAQSSFRVLERSEKTSTGVPSQKNGNRPPTNRPFDSPLAALRGRSAEQLNR